MAFYLVRKDTESPVEVSEVPRGLVYSVLPAFGKEPIPIEERADAESCAAIMNRPVNKPRVDWHGVWRIVEKRTGSSKSNGNLAQVS